jgi:hypothetical protein
MANELSRLIQDVAEMQRRTAGGVHQGTVDEVKGDKLRVVWGKDPDGKPVKSPWLDTANHRGGARERRLYKKGQNVTIDTVNGEMDESATVSADAPNEKFKAPDHAEEAGEDAETYQLGELHTTKKGDSYEVFLREEQKDDESSSGSPQRAAAAKPSMKFRLHKSGGVTGQVGEARFAAHEKGAKLRMGEQWVAITSEGIFFSSPPTLGGQDPIPNDDG